MAVSIDSIDREIGSRTKEVTAMSNTLVELDNHPGLGHVRLYPPTGVTAGRWAVIEPALAQLWEDLARMTAILESAQALRARRSRPNDEDCAELTRLLRQPTLEVSRRAIPLAQRSISGGSEEVETVGLADTADRMRAAFPAVAQFFDAVDTINTLLANRLAPLQKRLDTAGVPGPPELAALLSRSATDPLALTADEIEHQVAVIAAAIERRVIEYAELAAIQANWDDALAQTADRLDTLRAARHQADELRGRATQSVLSGAFPDHVDQEPELRAQLAALSTPDAAALRVLHGRIDAAAQIIADDEELAQGLLDRRSELKGRLTAYQAKAARLGLGEDRDLLAAGAIATGLLTRRPCDLRAVTRAIADYRQILADKQENPS